MPHPNDHFMTEDEFRRHHTLPPLPEVFGQLWDPTGTRRSGTLNLTTNRFTEDNDMNYIDEDAQGIARDALTERKTDSIREKVLEAVTVLSDAFGDAGDGTVFSFVKTVNGRNFHYAAIKSNALWYSTGSKTSLTSATDDDLITWLVGLGIYSDADLLAFAKVQQREIIEIEPISDF